MTEKGGKRNDREDSEDEQERVSLRRDLGSHQHYRHEDQHPEQRGVPDFPEQKVHGVGYSSP
jgi:hypothetical protein